MKSLRCQTVKCRFPLTGHEHFYSKNFSSIFFFYSILLWWKCASINMSGLSPKCVRSHPPLPLNEQSVLESAAHRCSVFALVIGKLGK